MPKLLATIKRFVGEASEAKALDVPNGSTFLETDTGDLYIFYINTGWELKEESGKALRIETIKRHSELLSELKKVNENLILVIEALDG